MKSFYKTPERRSIKYITVNIVPSEADYAKAKEKAEMNESVFATTDDVGSFLSPIIPMSLMTILSWLFRRCPKNENLHKRPV